jgi:hypothetical protein
MHDSQQALSLLDEGDNPVSRQLQQALRFLEAHASRSDSLRQFVVA